MAPEGSTFANQNKLPTLPIPPLDKTLQKYLKTLIPFVTSKSAPFQVNQQEYERIQSIIQDFGKTLGPQLQQRLLAYAKTQPDNWLDVWWLRFAYHAWREPLLINSNWFTVFMDHPQQPASLLHPKLPMVPDGHITPFQIYRSAGLITNALDMKEAIEKGTIPPEYMDKGKTALCMEQYKLMFGWTRVPVAGIDKIVNPGGFPSKSKHIIVMLRDQVYAVPVYDHVTHARLSIHVIERQLWSLVNDCLNTPAQPAICILTADQRDQWAEAHTYLYNLSAKNKEAFQIIESSIFAFCLDDYSLPDTYDKSFQNFAYAMDGHNRWYDKGISIICMNNGRAGMNGEHSPCDALIPSRLMDWLVSNEPAKDVAGAMKDGQFKAPWKLKWTIDDAVNGFLRRAEATIQDIIRNSDAGVLIYSRYGSEFMKNSGKISPDAYLQMALQLAFYRMHGTWTATYETASTRQFKLGRTETIRTCSVDVVRFLTTVSDASATPEQKYKALVQAARSHSKYTKEAMQGEGVDRHLMGLRLCLGKAESHPLFTDPVIQQSTTFRLSTSGLSDGKWYNGTGFGAAVSDGYGINYCLGPNSIKFGIESKRVDRATSTVGFKHALMSSLHDLQQLCLNVQGKL